MQVQIICVGKLKEAWWQQAEAEYTKRLKAYCQISVTEVKEARLPDKASRAEEERVKEAEGRAILNKIKESDYVISLEIKGKSFSSEGLSDKIQQLGIEGKSSLVFIIGGSLGLSREVSQRADLRLSFSSLTFPHQMMRIILLEQLYRSFKIIKGEQYHK